MRGSPGNAQSGHAQSGHAQSGHAQSGNRLSETEVWIAALAGGAAAEDDLALAEALVRRGAEIGAYWQRRPLTRTRKTSVSDFFTEADARAEADIVAALTQLRPDDAIVGEEGANAIGRSGRSWIIDPIDGTYNYASGLDHWCSAIALRGNGSALIGAVCQATCDETWTGRVEEDGQAQSWLNGIPLPRLPDRALSEVSIATYLHPTRFGQPEIMQPWLAACAGSATLRMLGSGSCDIARVAAGRLGAFLQHSTPDWDWFPGVALVIGAGGTSRVVEHRGYRWHVAGGARVVDRLSELLTSA
ncbi:MAG: inositol monophosphatase family protein [Tetrasphaera sp.]|jgi:myo-inositol-1(or 4)-monophosphatase|nr:inositol monophosphatase family protein [Tetrasphaera sp.]